eukprot:2058438-Prymnesium_polylepis.2
MRRRRRTASFAGLVALYCRSTQGHPERCRTCQILPPAICCIPTTRTLLACLLHMCLWRVVRNPEFVRLPSL